ncbi:MAG TPA: rRNA maturation RNase YbeY [Candidatus Acidoferrum sp.]|nr:rRNA maturation RNase YbeY [Candidatus Acidoferrum sp.]
MKSKKRRAKPAVAEREPAIENRQTAIRVELRGLLEFTRVLQEELGLAPGSVAVRLITDKEMARLNEMYRNKKGTTDVLSFPAEARRPPGNLKTRLKKVHGTELGDIAISPAVAKRNAKTNKRALPEELQILILHGLLHLLGYDHETDHGEMNRIEMRFRRRLGIA